MVVIGCQREFVILSLYLSISCCLKFNNNFIKRVGEVFKLLAIGCGRSQGNSLIVVKGQYENYSNLAASQVLSECKGVKIKKGSYSNEQRDGCLVACLVV